MLTAVPRYLEVVIFELYSTSQIAKASHIDNPRIFPSGQDFRHEQLRQKEMPNVVGTKLGLDTISGGSVGLDGHDCRATPSVVRYKIYESTLSQYDLPPALLIKTSNLSTWLLTSLAAA